MTTLLMYKTEMHWRSLNDVSTSTRKTRQNSLQK